MVDNTRNVRGRTKIVQDFCKCGRVPTSTVLEDVEGLLRRRSPTKPFLEGIVEVEKERQGGCHQS